MNGLMCQLRSLLVPQGHEAEQRRADRRLERLESDGSSIDLRVRLLERRAEAVLLDDIEGSERR